MVIESRLLVAGGGAPTALLLVEKTALQVARGLERIQSVLVQDKKFATYKLALVRSFCGIARNEPHVVRWGLGHVYVPQRRGETEGGAKPIAFRNTIEQLARHFEPGGLQVLLADLDTQPGDTAPPFAALPTRSAAVR